MIRRLLLSVVLIAAVAVAVPALAALTAQRDAQPAQISINTVVPAFEVAGMIPGDSTVRCLRVRNEGAAPISLAQAASITGELAPYLRIAVERGSGLGDLGPSCAGFVPAGGYAFGTAAGGVAPSALTPETDPSWAAGAEKSLRITIALPLSTPNAAIAKSGTVAFAFAGTPIDTGTGDGAPPPGGAIAPGTTGGYDAAGHFIPNATIKRRFHTSRARLLRNGDVVVVVTLPAGGSIRNKVILPTHHHYGQALHPVEWGPRLRVVMHRRKLGALAVTAARHGHRRLVAIVTTRYRWAHGPEAFVQLEQKLTLVR